MRFQIPPYPRYCVKIDAQRKLQKASLRRNSGCPTTTNHFCVARSIPPYPRYSVNFLAKQIIQKASLRLVSDFLKNVVHFCTTRCSTLRSTLRRVCWTVFVLKNMLRSTLRRKTEFGTEFQTEFGMVAVASINLLFRRSKHLLMMLLIDVRKVFLTEKFKSTVNSDWLCSRGSLFPHPGAGD